MGNKSRGMGNKSRGMGNKTRDIGNKHGWRNSRGHRGISPAHFKEPGKSIFFPRLKFASKFQNFMDFWRKILPDHFTGNRIARFVLES